MTNPTEEFRVLGLGKDAEIGASVSIELEGKTFAPIHVGMKGEVIYEVIYYDTITGDPLYDI